MLGMGLIDKKIEMKFHCSFKEDSGRFQDELNFLIPNIFPVRLNTQHKISHYLINVCFISFPKKEKFS